MREIQLLINELKQSVHDELLKDIYVDPTMLEYQKNRYIKALDHFKQLFGEAQVEIYSAPGRSEIGGNHTDHQHGNVLAAAVNVDAIAVVSPNEEAKIRVLSEGYEMITIDLNDLEMKEGEAETTAALIRGVVFGLQEKGFGAKGFSAYVTSDVLGGAGLSSSASFEVLIGTIISGLFHNMEIDPVEIAKVSQYAENVYFKKPSGLMDQMASSVGGLIHIDFKEVDKPLIKKVETDFASYQHSLCITDTKGSHADLTDDYAAIPKEMRMVAEMFDKQFLREVGKDDFYNNITKARAHAGDRPVLRAMHFFEDNERVLQQVDALSRGRFEEFLVLIRSSGSSSFQYLQNVYSNHDIQNQAVSIGLAVSERILKEKGAYRVHGGGFAGTIQAFVPDCFVEEYKEEMARVFGEGSCSVLKVRPYGGMKVL